MDRIIELIDSGEAYYTVKPKKIILGRRYDNNADKIKVIIPENEKNHNCTMIVTLSGGEIVDHIQISNGEYLITNNLSRHGTIYIGFVFTGENNYFKGSEIITGEFQKAQQPYGYVQQTPEQQEYIDAIIREGVIGLRWKDDTKATLIIERLDPAKNTELDFVYNGGTGTITTIKQQQSDWNELDEQKATYIKNKPTIPTKISQLTNDSNFLSENEINSRIETKIKEVKPTTPTIDLTDYATRKEAQKLIIIGASGVEEQNVYNFTVSDAESYLPYRTTGTKFLVDLHFEASGDITKTKKVAITFGDTTYYVFNILKGGEPIVIGDLHQVDKYSNATGYRFITEMIFFQTTDLTGFYIIPTVSMSDILSLDSNQMDEYMADGGLTQGQLAICNKVIVNGYTVGAIYRFDISYPTTYTWTELTTGNIGKIKTENYDNTTLAEHVDEILGYVNTENGGSLLNISFKLNSAIVGEMKTITYNLSTNTITNNSSTVNIVNASEMINLNVGTIRNGTNGGKKVVFNCASDTNTFSTANITISNINDNDVATLSGQEFDYGTNAIMANYFKDINILNTSLEHLTINHFNI